MIDDFNLVENNHVMRKKQKRKRKKKLIENMQLIKMP